MLIIADTSPLISLLLIDKLYLLEKLYGNYCIPEAVWHELTSHNAIRTYKTELEQLSKKIQKTSYQVLPINGIDIGETECILLYKELQADYLLIDDKKGREVAQWNDIKCIGTLTVLYKAKEKGYLTELRDLFLNLLEHKRFYSKLIMNFFLEQTNEKLL
jgi:predicted nucleic acid-binding protein